MTLNSDNHIEIINSYNRKHWQPLLDLIPEIESTHKFGEVVGGESINGVVQMPYERELPIVHKFRKSINQLGVLVSFDWIKWEYRDVINSHKEFNFDTIDIPNKCKLITAIVRSDRFSDGELVSVFESGLILKILQSIDKQLTN
jgi:hypothetical protein